MSIGTCKHCGVYGGHDADCKVFYTSIRTEELDRLRAQVADGRKVLEYAKSGFSLAYAAAEKQLNDEVLLRCGHHEARIDVYLAKTATK